LLIQKFTIHLHIFNDWKKLQKVTIISPRLSPTTNLHITNPNIYKKLQSTLGLSPLNLSRRQVFVLIRRYQARFVSRRTIFGM